MDAGYHHFPTEQYLAGLAEQVPADFKFGFKVTDEVTLKTFPSLPRFGMKAGTQNPNFLNPELFRESFLKPCQFIHSKVGPLIFEFSTFQKREFEDWWRDSDCERQEERRATVGKREISNCARRSTNCLRSTPKGRWSYYSEEYTKFANRRPNAAQHRKLYAPEITRIINVVFWSVCQRVCG